MKLSLHKLQPETSSESSYRSNQIFANVKKWTGKYSVIYNHIKHYNLLLILKRVGNIWAQNWDSLLPLLLNSTFDLEKAFQLQNYSEKRMVELAEDFYESMGLPSLPNQFWQHSQFLKPKNRSHVTCHGTAANMYNGDDVRYGEIYIIGVK